MGKKSKGKDKARKKDRKRAQRLAATAAEAGVEAADAEAADSVVADSVVADSVVAEVADIADARRRTVDPMELAARLASISKVLQRHLSRADAGEGLTRARLSALALLVLGGPRTLGDLAAAEHVRPPTMTRLIHAMEADGLVTRRPNPDDARSVVIEATPRGVTQLGSGRTRQIAPLAETIAELDRGERMQLEKAADLLGRVLRDSTWEPAVSDE